MVEYKYDKYGHRWRCSSAFAASIVKTVKLKSLGDRSDYSCKLQRNSRERKHLLIYWIQSTRFHSWIGLSSKTPSSSSPHQFPSSDQCSTSPNKRPWQYTAQIQHMKWTLVATALKASHPLTIKPNPSSFSHRRRRTSFRFREHWRAWQMWRRRTTKNPEMSKRVSRRRQRFKFDMMKMMVSPLRVRNGALLSDQTAAATGFLDELFNAWFVMNDWLAECSIHPNV